MILQVFFLWMLCVTSSFAAEGAPAPSEPLPSALELKAAEHLQWKPEDQALEAVGKVNLTYKGFVLQANRARLLYQGDGASPQSSPSAPDMTAIRAFDLEGSVVLKNPLYEITCQRAQYQFSNQRLQLMGDPIILKNNTDTAKIWGTVTVDLANARVDGVGPVHLSRPPYDIKGQDMTLIFLPWDIAKLQDATLNTAAILRDVVLTYPELKVTANHALYDQGAQTVTLTSNVILTRQNSMIRTEKGVLDLTTQRVKLSSPNQPVTGNIHVPDFEKTKPTDTPNPQPKDTP
jgi:lipopolysaccharide export system protein LptA